MDAPEESGEVRGLRVPDAADPARRLATGFRPPGSKSIGQRLLLAAAATGGVTYLAGLPDGDDVRAARALVEVLGARVRELGGGRLYVQGTAEPFRPRRPLQVGESGTLARLVTALAALRSEPGHEVELHATGSLLLRRSAALFRCLAAAGVGLTRQNLPGTWPVILRAAAPPDQLVLEGPSSSQEVSAMLLALAAHDGARSLIVRGSIPSRPYIDLTVSLLRRHGASIETLAPASEGHEQAEAVWHVRGPLREPELELEVEPDASSAAVLLAAAALAGSALEIPGLGRDALQGDVRIVEHLRAFGVRASVDGALRVSGPPDRAARLDLSGEPDLAPVLAAVAAGVARKHAVTSHLGGLGTLPGKESDRLAVLVEGLTRAGFRAEAGDDWLSVGPAETGPDAQVLLDPAGDHRMAFAFALLGLVEPRVLVRNAGCVAKSWPGFWEDCAAAGFGVV